MCLLVVNCACARQSPVVNKQSDERNCKGPEASNTHDAFAAMVHGDECHAGQPLGRRFRVSSDFGCRSIRVNVGQLLNVTSLGSRRDRTVLRKSRAQPGPVLSRVLYGQLRYQLPQQGDEPVWGERFLAGARVLRNSSGGKRASRPGCRLVARALRLLCAAELLLPTTSSTKPSRPEVPVACASL